VGGEEGCPPFPHHSWLADWISVSPPRVFECRERWHHSHHLLLTTSGEATINWTVDGARKTYHSGIGSVGFFPCDHRRHGMSITSIDGFTAYDLMIPRRHLCQATAFDGEEPPAGFQVMPVIQDALLKASLLRLSVQGTGRGVSEEIGDEIAARQVLLRISLLVGASVPEWCLDGGIFTPTVMRQLVAQIDANLKIPLSLDAMAEILRLSPGHFARKFRQSTGLSLSRFVNLRRISASCVLLRQGVMPLVGISVDLGFSSQSHFTRLFSGLTGLSPNQFRRLHR
jgi:AraC family transcriptional regulator